MILVDSNIPMYLIGADPSMKLAARELLEDAIAANATLCTDVEVLQEILHRYHAQRRPEFIDSAFAAIRGVVDVVYPIELADVERARRLLATTDGLSARDALHIAVMQGHDIETVMSFDHGFDGLPGIRRLGA